MVFFGKVKDPCGDCLDGHCTMNCSGREIIKENDMTDSKGDPYIESLFQSINEKNDEIKRLREALVKISSPTQSTNLLWWQQDARAALSNNNEPAPRSSHFEDGHSN